jgi:hypothetical protein
MYARVARWEGGDADAMRSAAAEINERAQTGPPEGVDGLGISILIDPDSGRSMAIGLFETMDKLRAGDKVLNEMSPPNDGFGQRTGVEVYEVAVEIRM